MLVSDALKKKGTDVITTRPETSVGDVARVLKGKGVGAIVVVSDGGAVAGIISERDVVHGVAMHGGNTPDMLVRDLMTERLITCRSHDTIDHALQQMMDHACRHLPVVEDGELKGLVSMSDVVKLRLQELHALLAEGRPSDEPSEAADGWPVKA